MEDQIIHMSFAGTKFKCPYCKKEYNDSDDKFLNRCNKNIKGYTKINCSCKNRFGMTYNIIGDAVGFKLISTNQNVKL